MSKTKRKYEDCTYDGGCETCERTFHGVDCHGELIVPEHTKAAFRANREIIGMTQQLLAKIVHVDSRSIKRFEAPGNPWNAPEAIWGIVDKYRASQEEEIESAIEKVRALEAREKLDRSEPNYITLIYWRNKELYELYHPKKGEFWQSANATIRQIAIELEALGYIIIFQYPSENTYKNAHKQICDFDAALKQTNLDLTSQVLSEDPTQTHQQFIEAYASAHKAITGKDWPPYSEKRDFK